MKALNLQIAATIAAVILTACSGSSEPSSVATEASAAADAAEAAGKIDTAQVMADQAAANADAAMAAADESAAPSKAEADEAIALLLNLNQLLCAEVVEVNPLKVRPGVLEVKCIEYRGGSATKNYIVDTNNGTAFAQ